MQIALAWLLHQGNDIVPIPGIKHIRYLEENAKSVDVKLPQAAWDEIEQVLKTFKIKGERYPEYVMKFVDKSE